MTTYRVDFESMAWEFPMEGVRHRVLKGDSRALRLVEYRHDMEPHWCAKGHIGYIIVGRLEIEFRSGKKEVFEGGDGVFIPPGDAHGHKARVLTDMVKAVFVEDV
jgi:quercetin dioxygenase-like cupin family protein